MKHLLETRGYIDRTGIHAVPAEVVKMTFQGTTSFIAKVQNTPDMTAVQDTLRTIREDAKSAKEERLQRLEALKRELRNTTTQLEQITMVGEETTGAAEEAAEVGKVGVGIMRDMKNNGLQNNQNAPMSYAAASASGQHSQPSQHADRIHTEPARDHSEHQKRCDR